MLIKKLRLDRGWSQEDLADMSGVSARTIQRVERGGKASLETLKCLAAVFEAEIPDLQKEPDMDKEHHKATAETAPETDGDWVRLDAEDRAALRYARQLRRYDDWYDDETGWGEWGEDNDFSALSPQERAVRQQVRREREFWLHFLSYAVLIVAMLVVNILTSAGYLWVLWVALAWGAGLGFHAMDVFWRGSAFGDDWERRQVERRLKQVAQRGAKSP